MHDQADNPYASPQEISSPEDVPGAAVLDEIIDDPDAAFREGHYAVVPNGIALPQRCVHCNGTGAHPVTLRFVWRLAIVGPQMMRTRYWVCNKHRTRRSWQGLFQFLAVVVPLGLAVAAGAGLVPGMLLVLVCASLFVGLAATILVNAWCGGYVAAALADRNFIYVAGCGRRFLRSLPPRSIDD